MDVMAIQLLELFISKGSHTSLSLEKKFSWTKGQLDYRIKKVNQELTELNLGKIKKNGTFFLLEGQTKAIKSYLTKVSPSIHLSDRERECFLYLIILLHQGETLQTLAEKLFVSKNTILNDKRKLSENYLKPLAIDLQFSRKRGFYFVGNEVEIRRLGIKFIREVEKSEDNLEYYLAMIKVQSHVLTEIKERIHLLEQELGLEFTEFKLVDLYLTSYMCSVRFGQGNELSPGVLGNYVQMVEKDFYSKVCQALKPFFKGANYLIEIHFISIQLLSTNLIKIRSNYKDQELLRRIQSFISSFEILGITDIKNKEQLEEAIYQHIIPAYYRIKFGLPDNELLFLDNVENYDFIHPLVHQSIGIIEDYLKIIFPEGELIYLSVILLSFINEELEKQKRRKIRAVVVCQHGVSVSKLLLGELKQLFTTIDFTRNLSLREFYEERSNAVDIVFSTVPVNTKKEVFLIPHFLTDEDKMHLISDVRKRIDFDETFSLSKNHELVQNLLSIIKKNTQIINEEQLTQEIQDYLLETEINEGLNFRNLNPDLKDLLPLSHIQIYPSVKSVEEAIRIAGKPLINEGYVSPKYIETVIEHYDPEYPYSVISPDLAIPHAGPDDGVYRVGMSFLKLDQPISFAENISISMIVVIAPKDKKSHIKAVTHLYELAKKPSFISAMKQANYEKDIRNYFQLEVGK
ncbi:PTS sugar transporter subunit IIA [Enterococcus hulanensis]|uniref:PTS sugar transporter subunit IIA n=1 Tax=Enterococcus hulanensis TaxID=2559929 RepID=A0ABU3F454_9ENTE|nr:PTS sugar transporter subunit IIA [Enterococcus hulanensis]MDT2601897.1 PTS sugar transporter subunit IIA [Enterococcus hulanensis]MDT2611394.1 PTS sugar transporter subunit IIA [Enterococcus hulanensis]MDT2618690.1 PTS sugar transporter subunit IIA [Enterococcus hulanensis]MDT2629969.1 PTS sugar transporter subunit IIA [Enterococcus hulanensis]MDT2657676.1 PTS sugar transporter subunit IIA [Enterococcus hulanensis]